MYIDGAIASTPVVDVGLAAVRTSMSLPALDGPQSDQSKMVWRNILNQVFGHIDDYGRFVQFPDGNRRQFRWGTDTVTFAGGVDEATAVEVLGTPFPTACESVLLTGTSYLYILYYTGVSKTGFTVHVVTRDGTGPAAGTTVAFSFMLGGY